MRHVIDTEEFTLDQLQEIFISAEALQTENSQPLKGKILASLFFEPSTRTRFSFESAMHRLGGQVISSENAREFSSAAKGETLEDTIKVVNHYADIIVLRHPEVGAAKCAVSAASVPIINAGDGGGQHPTQALLDAFTIGKEMGMVSGLRIALIGDLKHSRTIRSLAYILALYPNVEVLLVSPQELTLGEDVLRYLCARNVVHTITEDFEYAVASADVVYQNRIQKERFSDPSAYERVKDRFVLTLAHTERMLPHAIIMNPLPRTCEIAPEVDASPRARYFVQAKYGVWVRMALLKMLLA